LDRKSPETSDEEYLNRLKLRYEIDELRAAPGRARFTAVLSIVTAVLSLLTTITIASVGWWISARLEAQAQHDRVAQTYRDLLDKLNDRSEAVRADAVAEMAPFLKQPIGGEDRTELTLRILLTHLRRDSNETVVSGITKDVQDLGSRGIAATREENNIAAEQLAVQINGYVYNRWQAMCKIGKTTSKANVAVLYDIERGVQNAAYSAFGPRGLSGDEMVGGWIAAAYPPRDVPCIPRSNDSTRPVSMPDTTLLTDVVATSRILESTLPGAASINVGPGRQDVLTGVQWSTFTLGRRANLANLDLRFTHIDGKARGASFAYANLEGADLFWLDMRGANLEGAKLTHTTFSAEGLLRNPPYLKNANWWNADISEAPRTSFGSKTLDPNGCSRVMEWLRTAYPRPGHARRAGHCPKPQARAASARNNTLPKGHS
jgi:hypothetical protein